MSIGLAIVGYGKMGRLIEQLAPEYGFEVRAKFDARNNPRGQALSHETLRGADVAVEFTSPDAAPENIRRLAVLGVNSVIGTTGWFDDLPSVRGAVAKSGTGLVWAPNFSVGVNLFLQAVAHAAALFAKHADYEAWGWEIHHSAKKDAPSGTLKKLAEEIRAAGYERTLTLTANRAGAHHAPTYRAEPRRFCAWRAPGRALGPREKGSFRIPRDSQRIVLREKGRNSIMFTGAGTALVTPFRRDGSLDGPALRALIKRQIDAGIDFLVPCGTTGESPTLTHEEHLRVVQITVELAKGKAPVLAGAGGYNTAEVITLARQLADLGADGILSVTPYYNKPTQEGLFQHYRAIAEAVALPIILYSVQGRTGVNIEPATVKRLSQIENIVGIKEASGNVSQMAAILNAVPDDFIVLSGDDAITLPLIALGGRGVISVVSNEIPAEMSELTRLALQGDFAGARRGHRRYHPLMEINFVESNPIPVKAAMAEMGLLEPVWRLPLVPPKAENQARIRAVLESLGLDKRVNAAIAS